MAEYPLPKWHFQVEWGGTKAGFTEVTGLKISAEVIKYRTGDSLESNEIKMPGRLSYPDVSLKRGTFAGDNEFYDWFNTIALNTVERRDITISLLNESHDPVVVWKLKNCWAKDITPPTLTANSNEVAIEQIDIVHEGLTIEHV